MARHPDDPGSAREAPAQRGGSGRDRAPLDQAPPPYRRYRARPRSLRERLRGGGTGLDALRPGDGGLADAGRDRRPGTRAPRWTPRTRRPITLGRAIRWLLLAVGAWVGLSLVLFLVSAQIERGKLADGAEQALSRGGFPLTSPTNVLFLGSDQRPAGTKEPGANPGGPSRSDAILLWRVGAGKSARLSIPRDTIVDIPGHGRHKINAAYALGGAALAIDTVEQFLGIPVHHLVEVDFENFPQLIDALGGIDVRTGRVCSEISGGARNGGWTLNLRRGTHRLDGEDALALARTRKNRCNPSEDDLTRARRQQQILSAIGARATSPSTFLRLPWVAWSAPKALRTDMGGPSLLGFFAATAIGGSPPVRVLRPSGYATLPDGGSGLVVSDADKQAAVARFLDG